MRANRMHINTCSLYHYTPWVYQALGDYYHSKGLKYALYTAESPTTCGGYPASANHEMLDAKTFASWGVDYMKVDG